MASAVEGGSKSIIMETLESISEQLQQHVGRLTGQDLSGKQGLTSMALVGLVLGLLMVTLLRCVRSNARGKDKVDPKFKQVAEWAGVVRKMVSESGSTLDEKTILRFLVADKSDSLAMDFSDVGLSEATAKQLKANGVSTTRLGRELLKSYRRAHLNDTTADMFRRLQEARDIVSAFLERNGASSDVASNMSTLVMGRAFLMLLLLGNLKDANPDAYADRFLNWHSAFISSAETCRAKEE